MILKHQLNDTVLINIKVALTGSSVFVVVGGTMVAVYTHTTKGSGIPTVYLMI
jgi:hypothetical protein